MVYVTNSELSRLIMHQVTIRLNYKKPDSVDLTYS